MMFYDITRELSTGTYVYSGDPLVHLSMSESNTIRVSEIRMGSHSGTHIDAPIHYIPGGASIDEIPLDACIGTCLLRSVSPGPVPPDISGDLPSGIQRLFISSGWQASCLEEYGYLTENDARTLVERGIVAVGTDAPSIEAHDGDGSVHRILLSAGVVVIELLSLTDVPDGTYMVIALPLKLKGIDGSPARVVLCDLECGLV